MELRLARCCICPLDVPIDQCPSTSVEISFTSLFLSLAIVNRSGHDCPYSLRIIACLLLYEITSFLRETYETLPKLSSLPPGGMTFRQQQQQQRTNNQGASGPQTLVETSSTLTEKRSNDRIRMGSVVSQTSNRSSVSISSEHPARMCFSSC